MSPSRSRRRRPRKKKSNTKKIIAIVALFAVVMAFVVGYIMLGTNNFGENNSDKTNSQSIMKVLLETSKGDIIIQLRDDMPITTSNFKNLVQEGVYDGTIFHRVISDFMIQGGDPTGTGYGDPSIPNIQDEFSTKPDNNKNERGTIAMANTGAPNSGSSQFFINVVYNNHLDNLHPVFGDVIEGMDVVDLISNMNTNDADKPVEDITIIRATLVN